MSKPILSSRVWLYQDNERVKGREYKGKGSLSNIEKYWYDRIESFTSNVNYNHGQLVIHIHNSSGYDMYLPFELQEKLTKLKIEIRFVFWGDSDEK